MIKKRFTDLSGYLFLIIFLGFLSSNTFFNHTHLVDGYAIVHSHPYKSDSSGRPLHNHPLNGFLLVHTLNYFLATVIIGLVLTGASVITLKRAVAGYEISFISRDQFPVNSLRGPPQALLFLF